MKIIYTLLLSFLFFSFIKEEKIKWDPNQKLVWENFKGTPNPLDDFVASTSSGISFSYSVKSENNRITVTYEVAAHFYPQSSWVTLKGKTPYILTHEQTHFDITEIHARLFKKGLAQLEKNQDFKENAEKLYRQVEIDRVAMQKQYDLETDHSKIETKEYAWQEKVAQQLAQLDSWK